MSNKKYVVLVDRISLVVEKGSTVIVDERQYEVARPFLKEVAVSDEKPEEASKDIVPDVKVESKKSLANAVKEGKVSNKQNNRK